MKYDYFKVVKLWPSAALGGAAAGSIVFSGGDVAEHPSFVTTTTSRVAFGVSFGAVLGASAAVLHPLIVPIGLFAVYGEWYHSCKTCRDRAKAAEAAGAGGALDDSYGLDAAEAAESADLQ